MLLTRSAEADKDKVLNVQHAIEEAMSACFLYDHSLTILTRINSQRFSTRVPKLQPTFVASTMI
jgi:hypothetical protein